MASAVAIGARVTSSTVNPTWAAAAPARACWTASASPGTPGDTTTATTSRLERSEWRSGAGRFALITIGRTTAFFGVWLNFSDVDGRALGACAPVAVCCLPAQQGHRRERPREESHEQAGQGDNLDRGRQLEAHCSPFIGLPPAGLDRVE